MRKNGDIRAFFGGAQAPQRPASQLPSSHTAAPALAAKTARDPSPRPSYAPATPLPDISSSPPSPPYTNSPNRNAPRQAYSRDTVIAGTDDEGSGDSDDDSLPDIFSIGPPRPLATATATAPTAVPSVTKRPAPTQKSCVTPRAKRTATQDFFNSSPLTIRQHKYDMETLLDFTRKDEAIRASSQRLSAFLEQEADMQRRGLDGACDDKDDDTKAALKEHMLQGATGDGEDDEGGGTSKMRIARALERTEIGNRRQYYFFEQQEPEPSVVGRRFPRAKATGSWAVLGDAQDRPRHFQSGFPLEMQRRFKNMPDEIFLWVLDEVCSERRRDLQTEYVKLLCSCGDQVRRLVTPTLLQQLFKKLGAIKDVDSLSSPVTLREEINNPYPDHDWTCLEKLLELIGNIAVCFSSATRTTAMQILLRLGMDTLAVESSGLTQEWRRAVDHVARAVSSEEWTSFCQEACSSLYQSSAKATMRWRAILLLGPVHQRGLPATVDRKGRPIDLQRRTLDLKRRLASVFFFDDLKRADKRPEDTVNIRSIIDRLEDDEFQINANTDYKELQALMMMLNVALGDASRHVETSETDSNFDAEVDELAEGMKSMLTRVAPLNKGIHISRMEAKNAMELIRERLLYQVRIKSVPKIGVFGMGETEDTSLPKQQDFMKGFFIKKRVKTLPTIVVDTTMAG